MPNHGASSGRDRPTWVDYGLDLADAARSRSEDPYVQVGAVILRSDHSVASIGYNGPPPGVDIDWSNRDERRELMIHAEVNALRWCTKTDVASGIVCISGTPCPNCLASLAAYQPALVVYRRVLENYPAEHSHDVARKLGIRLVWKDNRS